MAQGPVAFTQPPVGRDDKTRRGEQQSHGHFSRGHGVVVQVVHGHMGKIRHQPAGRLGRTRERDNDGLQIGAGGQMLARGVAGHEDMKIGRVGKLSAGAHLDGWRQPFKQHVQRHWVRRVEHVEEMDFHGRWVMR